MFERFYLIVDESFWLERFLPLGLKLVQLRMKGKSQIDILASIKDAKELCDKYQCTLIINDYWQEAMDLGCDYVHLGQEDLDGADVKALRKAGVRLGISTHDEAELERALSLNPDYVALGPIYFTQLKAMKWQPQGLEKLAQWKKQVGQVPLVAIGGFTPERAAGAFAHGADSVCVVSDVLQHSNPEDRLKQWLDVCLDDTN